MSGRQPLGTVMNLGTVVALQLISKLTRTDIRSHCELASATPSECTKYIVPTLDLLCCDPD